MSPARRWTAIFAIVAVVAALFALVQMRLARETELALSAARRQGARLEAEIAAAKGRNKAAADRLAALRLQKDGMGGDRQANGNAAPKSDSELMKEERMDPMIQALNHKRFRAFLAIRYGPLFRKLGLSPTQIEKFENLLSEHQGRMQDINVAALSLGMEDSSPEIATLLDANKDQLKTEEVQLLGQSGYEQLADFEKAQPDRILVHQLADDLISTSTPLSAQQSEQLASTLHAARDANQPGGSTNLDGIDWDGVQAQAAAYLSPPQMAELASSVAGRRAQAAEAQLETMIRAWEKEAPK